MGRKKKQSSKGKKSTYKPKWAKQDATRKTPKKTLLVPKEEGEGERVVLSDERLPLEYNPPDNLAYTFPPFVVVGILIFLIVLLAAILF